MRKSLQLGPVRVSGRGTVTKSWHFFISFIGIRTSNSHNKMEEQSLLSLGVLQARQAKMYCSCVTHWTGWSEEMWAGCRASEDRLIGAQTSGGWSGRGWRGNINTLASPSSCLVSSCQVAIGQTQLETSRQVGPASVGTEKDGEG